MDDETYQILKDVRSEIAKASEARKSAFIEPLFHYNQALSLYQTIKQKAQAPHIRKIGAEIYIGRAVVQAGIKNYEDALRSIKQARKELEGLPSFEISKVACEVDTLEQRVKELQAKKLEADEKAWHDGYAAAQEKI